MYGTKVLDVDGIFFAEQRKYTILYVSTEHTSKNEEREERERKLLILTFSANGLSRQRTNFNMLILDLSSLEKYILYLRTGTCTSQHNQRANSKSKGNIFLFVLIVIVRSTTGGVVVLLLESRSKALEQVLCSTQRMHTSQTF